MRRKSDHIIVGIGRTFDEHDIGRERLERRAQAARGARTMMSNAEDVNARIAHTSARQAR
jgi:hypothetical protein